MDEDFKTLRRKEDSLWISGIAVLLFCVWDIIRFTMAMIMDPHALLNFVEKLGLEPDEIRIGEVVVIVLYAVILFLAFLIRLFIFRSARAESRGKKKGWGYVIVAALVLIFIISDQISTVIQVLTATEENAELMEAAAELDTTAASGLLNITSAIALIDIIISSATIKKIRKKYNIKDGEVI